MIKLYHCDGTRSFRVLWMLEELGLPYELAMLPFPPRVHAKDYLGINPLGTVPYLIDGDARMTESSGICHYLAETYGPTNLRVGPADPDYAAYINWVFFSDATLTFPQAIVLRYSRFETPERLNPSVAADYEAWFFGRLRAVTGAVTERDYLCADRFTTADVAVGYALHLADILTGLSHGFPPPVADYLERLRERPAFVRARERETEGQKAVEARS